MRYANLMCDELFTIKEALEMDDIEKVWNVGDYIQILAIDNFYKLMGIREEEIVRIRMQDLKTYRGERLLLPINLIMYGDNFFDGSDIAISEDIVPVFLGVRFFHYFFSEKTKQYFRKFGPIGCRDESVLLKMREMEIPSYLAGCITITLPKRKKQPEDGKVYLVDVPDEFYQYLPDWVKSNMIETTSVYKSSKADLLQGKTMGKFVEEKYKEYYENAKLVITSRMHVASPCLAAGIPVVLVRESVNDRFAWIDKFIKIYTPEEFKSIDWENVSVDIEKEKQRIIDSSISIIKGQYARYSAMEKVSALYEERERSIYQSSLVMSVSPIIEYIENHWKVEEEEKYAIWGWSVFAEEVVKYVTSNYPKAKLIAIFDSYRTFEKYGIVAQLPSGLKDNKEYVTFITSDAVSYIAEDFFNRHAFNAKEGEAYVLMKYGAEIQQ